MFYDYVVKIQLKKIRPPFFVNFLITTGTFLLTITTFTPGIKEREGK